MRELLGVIALIVVVLVFGACGGNQLRLAEIQANQLSAAIDDGWGAIVANCSDLDGAPDAKVELCAAAEVTYQELQETMSALLSAIRAAEKAEDPNMANVAELALRAAALADRLKMLVEVLGEL